MIGNPTGGPHWAQRGSPRDESAPRADAPAIEFVHVTAHRDGQRALDDVTLEILRGATVALLGPSGAGKSTAVEIGLAVRRADSGVVRVLGMEPAIAVASGRVGALLPVSLPSGTRVGELLSFFRALHDAPLPVDDLVERGGVGSVLDRTTDRLSKCEAQRLRFALALAGDPDVVLLDEPGDGLDPDAREALGTNLRRLRTEGRTVLLATRHGEVAASSADRVLLIEGGRLTGEADPDVMRLRLAAHRPVLDRRPARPSGPVAAPGQHG